MTVTQLGAARRLGVSKRNPIIGIGLGTHISRAAELQAITDLIDADLGNCLRNLILYVRLSNKVVPVTRLRYDFIPSNEHEHFSVRRRGGEPAD